LSRSAARRVRLPPAGAGRPAISGRRALVTTGPRAFRQSSADDFLALRPLPCSRLFNSRLATAALVMPPSCAPYSTPTAVRW
jgi:hypothetical protein